MIRKVAKDLLPQFRRKLFRILQLAMSKSLRQNRSRCDDRPGERAPARFINPCDAENA
jgi:hypothetical protein